MMKWVERAQIDEQRWNDRVQNAVGFKHYYLTYYLDHAAEKWCALIDEDYECVWPIPYKSALVKWGYQPLLCQQLGPIGRILSDEELKVIEKILNQRLSWWQFKFNDTYRTLPYPNQVSHRNITLDLSSSYDEVAAGYNRNIRSNLSKFMRSMIALTVDSTYHSWAVEQFRVAKGPVLPELDDCFYKQVKKIYEAFAQRGEAQTFLALSDDDILAQVMILTVQKRHLLFFTHSNDEGRRVGAMHALIDKAVEYYAGEPQSLLDFEGSDHDNLAYFYRSFGGSERVYLQAGTKSIIHTIKDRLSS